MGGKTYVVIGSRSNEEWLQKTTFKQNIYQLCGLDQESRTVLAEKILERHVLARRIPKIREDDDFQQLMKVLAGYPLAMQVVLANLRNQSPKEILAAVQAGDVNLDSDSTDKTASIIKCVEYSHSNLSDQAQQLLLCLAPFSGFIYRSTISEYIEELKKLGVFKSYPFDEFDDAIQAAIDWGLLSPIDYDLPELLNIHPLFPYFLEARLKEIDGEIREAVREGFKNHYLSLAAYYQHLMESKDPQERQLGIVFCRWEYENLYQALQICLEKQESVSIFFCLYQYFELISNVQSQLKLSEFVCKAHEAYPSEIRTGEIGYEIILILGNLASCYLDTQNYQQAKESYQKVIKQLQQLSGVEATQIKSTLATTYHQLGRVAEELREFEQARNYYQQALDINIEFGARYDCARTYHQLGRVAEELREFEQARNYYQQALDINIEFDARYDCARTYHQLGRVAEELREFEQARNYYQQALDINIEFGARYDCARTYHQLGRVAEELREFEQARNYYQQALNIFIEFGARYDCARTYHQLGIVAQELREFEQARNYYQQALDIKIEFGARYDCARTYHQLGRVAEELREFEQARNYYQQALDINIEFDARYDCARTYHQLGRVAEELREFEQARNYYQQALDIKIEFGARYDCARTYHQLGRVAQDLWEFEQAKNYYQQALDIYIKLGARYECAGIYHNLGMVAQDLREFEQAKNDYHQALELKIEFGARYECAGIYHNLGTVVQELREFEQARKYYQQALELKIEFGARYECARTYGNLGLLAEKLEDFAEAKVNLLQAFAIFAEFYDERNSIIALKHLARIYKSTKDESILQKIAQWFGWTVEKVKKVFENLGNG